MIFTIIWRKQSKLAVISSAFLGMATGLGVWLGSAYAFSGEVSISSTGGTLPCMYGTVASLFSPMVYSVAISLLRPQSYDWNDFKKEKLAIQQEDDTRRIPDIQNKEAAGNTALEHEGDKMQKLWASYALWWAIATFIGHWVLWPLPMYTAKYTFSKQVSSRQSRLLRAIFNLLISTLLPVLHCLDCSVADLAVVDSACGWFLPTLGRSPRDQDGAGEALEGWSCLVGLYGFCRWGTWVVDVSVEGRTDIAPILASW